MGKISSIYLAGKNYLKSFFSKSAKSTETVAAETIEQLSGNGEPAKVTSKQIEAYYKRYNKHLAQKPKTPNQKKQSAGNSELLNRIEKECDAYNQTRYADVTEEGLKILETNFEEKRQKVVQTILKYSELLPTIYLDEVKTIKTPEELSRAIRAFVTFANRGLNIKYRPLIENLLKGKNITLKQQQDIFRNETKICDEFIMLIKNVTEESKDPEVIKIENLLKSMYDMDYVHLECPEEAKKILASVKLARQNNVPLPKNIIVTPFLPLQAVGINMIHKDLSRTVLLTTKHEIDTMEERAYKHFVMPETQEYAKSLRAQDAAWYSTKDEKHISIHELCHSMFYLDALVSSRIKPIPPKYKKLGKQLGVYANTLRTEFAAELKTKSLLETLNKDEQEALNYFEEYYARKKK